MHRADKTPEPSMEEILASIRKIIAEEPIGSRPGSEPYDADGDPPLPAGGPARRTESHALPMPPRDQEDDNGPPYSVEDALADLMDDPSQRHSSPAAGKDESPKPQARPSMTDEDSRPSWLFGRQSSPAAPAQPSGGTAPGPAGGQGGGLLGQLGAMRDSPERAASEGGTSSEKPASLKPLEFGSIFDRQREASRPGPADFPTLPQVQSQDVPRPAAPRVPTRDAGPSVARADQGSELVPPAGSAGTRGSASVPTARSPDPAPQGVSPRREAAAEVAAAKPEDHLRPVPPQPDVVPQNKPVPPAADRENREGSREKSGAPTVVQSASSPRAEKAAALAAPQVLQPTGARTLEDTVAELLRPMLREWLDANMPRIVEKALRVELAASAKRTERRDD